MNKSISIYRQLAVLKIFDEEEERLLRVSPLGGEERIQDQEPTVLMAGHNNNNNHHNSNNSSEEVDASVLKVHDQGVEIPETAHQISSGLSLFPSL